MSKKRLIFGIIFTSLYIITIVMIIKYSFENGTKSIESSSGVTDVVGSVVETIAPDKVDVNKPAFASLIRKLFGHFGLFAANCFLGLIGLYLLLSKKWLHVIIVLSIGIILSVSTEYFQIIAGDRRFSISDMFINAGGCLLGLLLSYLIVFLSEKKLKRNNDFLN